MSEIAMRKVRAGDVGRNSYCLVPVDQIGAEDFGKLPNGRDLFVQTRDSINMAKWRLLQVLFAKMADAHPDFHDRDDAKEYLCYAARHVHRSVNPRTGNWIVSAKSTSPYGMSAEEFDALFERAFRAAIDLLPGIPPGKLREEIEKMVAPNFGGRS